MGNSLTPETGANLAYADNGDFGHIPSRFLLDLDNAAATLNDGGLLIYPTETFFALGCRCDAPEAAAAIGRIKARSAMQPVPLLCANFTQANELVDLERIPSFLQDFWPGPLTVLAPPRRHLSPPIANTAGKIALRITSSPIAAALAQVCGPLTCSSANLHGTPPTTTMAAISRQLLERLEQFHLPFGIFKSNSQGSVKALPSTIVEPVFNNDALRLHVVRPGAIAPEILFSKLREMH